jgi:hypothetical protein
MELESSNNEVYYIIKRFNSKYKLRRNPDFPNPNILSNYIEDISLIKIYKRFCTYSNNENMYKENLVIKYKYKNKNEIITLNIPFDEYKDLLTSSK